MIAEEAGAVRRIHGSYHRGNIRLVFYWPEVGNSIPVCAHGYSFCTKHRGVWTSNPKGRLELLVGDPSRGNCYQFGTGTVDCHICFSCRVAPIVTKDIDGSEYAAVNVNCFDDVESSELDDSISDSDGETMDVRFVRRQRSWSPLVMTA